MLDCPVWYVRLRDMVTGQVRVLRGEQLVLPEPHEECLDNKTMSAIDLKVCWRWD